MARRREVLRDIAKEIKNLMINSYNPRISPGNEITVSDPIFPNTLYISERIKILEILVNQKFLKRRYAKNIIESSFHHNWRYYLSDTFVSKKYHNEVIPDLNIFNYFLPDQEEVLIGKKIWMISIKRDFKKCPMCDGSGVIDIIIDTMLTTARCPVCKNIQSLIDKKLVDVKLDCRELRITHVRLSGIDTYNFFINDIFSSSNESILFFSDILHVNNFKKYFEQLSYEFKCRVINENGYGSFERIIKKNKQKI